MENKLTAIAIKIEEQFPEYLTGTIGIKNIDIYTITQNIIPKYRLYIFSKFCDMLDIEDYNMGLKYAYTKTEGINNKEAKLSVDQVLGLFKRIHRKI